MANNITLNANIVGNINGLGINEAGNVSLTPNGSTVLAESTQINTGAYQLVLTGSNFGTASIFYVENTGTTGSINLAISTSAGLVSNLGNIPAASATATVGVPSVIQWNNTFNGLYAQATPSASNVVFVVASA
jgi:hypothetical protein